MTREEYLNAACAALRPIFAAAGFPLPERIRMTCGFPSKSALARKARRIGECWSDVCSADAHFEIFISPVLADSVEVIAVLVHELAHAAVGLACGHKGAFVRCVRAMLLEGKPASTVAGDAFKRDIYAPLAAAVGDYPHATLVAMGNAKKQTTRLRKCECADCGYTVRVTAKWIDEAGAPLCPCNSAPMQCA
jgi:hypothetical protein